MSLPLIIAGSVISGFTSYLSGQRAEEDAARRRDLIVSNLEESKVTGEERRELIDQLSDLYNTNLLGELNNSSIAIATLGASNPASARTEIAGKILGQRSQSIFALQREITETNKAIDMKIAEANANVPTSSGGIEDFVIGAAAIVPTTLGISEAIELNKEDDQFEDLYKKWFDKGDKTPTGPSSYYF